MIDDLRGAPRALPAQLAALHRRTEVDAVTTVLVDDIDAERLADIVEGGGFELIRSRRQPPWRELRLRRCRTLPDTVGPGMPLLLSGLNPSLYAADAGVGFARPGNRFWPAMTAAGLATLDRDPDDLLRRHHIGMTDVVKRATPRADALGADEYEHGMRRLDRLCEWLEPDAVCLVGLAGWRAAVDRRAVAGWQPTRLGGRPVYVMPSTRGLNASSTPASLTQHLRIAAGG